MKKIKSILTVALLITQIGQSQIVDIEKTYEISRKSKRGFLSGIDYNSDEQTYQLTYITKQNDRKLKYEFYKFDKDFNFLNDGEGEEIFEKMKTKFRWFKFRDLLYSVEGVTVENNLMGTLVMRKKLIEFKYDFWIAGYYRKVTVLEKLKPKTDDGRKMSLVAYTEDNKTGDILVLAAIKLKLGKNMAEKNPRPYDLYFMRFNKDLDIVSETIIPFETPQTLLAAKAIFETNEEDPENPGVESMAVTLATAPEKNLKPTCTYLRLGADTKIIHRQSFVSNANYWNLDEMILDQNTNDMYLFGPAVDDLGKYSKGKFKSIQLAKINNKGEKEFLTETELEEISKKLKTPPTQKSAPEYEGKKFEFSTYKVSSTGDLFVSGQNYKIDQAGNDKGSKNFKDIMGFHFDSKGLLKSQYGIDTKENGNAAQNFGTPQLYLEGNDGNMYWMIREIKDFNALYGKLLTYPRLGKITPDAKVSDFLTIGKSDGYYLDPKYPFLEINKGNNIVFFGANKSGKSIWFCRVNLK